MYLEEKWNVVLFSKFLNVFVQFMQIRPQIANSMHLTIQLGKTDSDKPKTGAYHMNPNLHQPWSTQASIAPPPQMPTPSSQFIIRVAELSRVKAQERQWGPVLDPHSAQSEGRFGHRKLRLHPT